jgi:hypothetical protein
MYDLKIEQLSPDWHIERLWRLTSSDLKSNITAGGKLSDSDAAKKSINKLIAGIDASNEIYASLEEDYEKKSFSDMDPWEKIKFLAAYIGDKFKGSVHTERGNELEDDAMNALSDRVGRTAHDGSMIVMGNSSGGVVACSPDAQFKNDNSVMDAGGEVKCPSLCTWYGYILKDELPAEHKPQVHASMAITGCKVWHFGAYFPGKPLFYKRVEWDEFTDNVKEALEGFTEAYKAQYKLLEAAELKLEGGSNE